MAHRFALALALALLCPKPARACAPAPRAGQRVDIAGEEALIVWDEASGTEHFIRRADFATKANDFGFLVPTPTQPALAEAPNEVFAKLAARIAPPVVWVPSKHYRAMWCTPAEIFFARSAEQAVTAAAPQVRVLDRQRVAGYDAAVLEADSATALAEWLEQHGYDFRAELKSWLEPYVASKWKITAFKIAAKDETVAAVERDVGTSAVRMSFKTERPFFPYREPADQRRSDGPKRTLRVYFVGPFRVDGTIGASGGWPHELSFAAPLLQDAGGLLDGVLPAGAAATPDRWLSAFLDSSSPRPGTDELYFARAADTSPFRPPPIEQIDEREVPIPIDLLAILAVASGLIARWRRRRRERAA